MPISSNPVMPFTKQSGDSRVRSKLEELSRSLGKKTSVADQIAGVIKNLIISGDLNPGDRIVESRVARQLGVGQPTVREALAALEHQGLVYRRANQGCVVTQLSRAEIEQALRIRAELEVLAIELAAENASEEDLAKLSEYVQSMRKAAETRNVEEFFTNDLSFHETVWHCSGNVFLPKLLSQLMAPLLAFLFIRNLRNNAQIDLVASTNHHVELVKAIASRDKWLAREVAYSKFQTFADQHVTLIPESQ